MKDTLKRLTCMLLALIMVAGMFPVSVFAEAENPISVDAGSTVSNVIGPIGAPETSQEPVVQTPVEEVVVEEPVEEIPEAPAFDPAEPIEYQTPHSVPFSVLKVLVEAGAPVNTIIDVTGDMTGKVAANVSGSDRLLTTYNYFDSLDLSVTAKNAPDGEETVYTVILSNPDPSKPVPMPAVTLTATVDNTNIVVDAPEGAFPEGIQMRAEKADPEALLVASLEEIGYSAEEAAALAQIIIASGEDLSAYIQNFTLTFYLPKKPDIHIEPEKEVEVRFENLAIDTEKVAAFHDDGGSVETLDADATGSGVIISVPSFSDTGAVDLKGILKVALRASNWPQPLIALADSYYGPGGTCDPPPVYVAITEGPALSSRGPKINENSILAGQTLFYRLEYGLAQAKNFADPPYDPPQPLYDDFHDVVLTVTLPAGLILNENGHHFPMTSDPNDRDLTASHTYTITLPPDANGRYPVTSEGFDLQIFVGNNGTANSLHDYNLSDCIALTASFDVVDKTSELPYPQNVVKTYTKTATAGMDPIGTITPDVWGVNKAQSKAPVVNQSANTVTFEWQIDVGLVTGKDSNNRSILQPDGDKYTREGADELTSLSIADTLSQFLNSAPLDLDPTLVTIQKTGTGTTAVTLLDSSQAIDRMGQDIIIWGPIADDDLPLKMNESLPVLDKDGDKNADTTTPLYTSYIVKATYNVESLVGEFYDPSVGTLKANNTVDLTATLANGRDPQNPIIQEDSDDPDSVTPLYKKKPAKIDITKKLQTLNEGVVDPYDGRFGNVTYTLTTSDGSQFKVYTKNGDTYSPFADAQSVTITDNTKSYYVLPLPEGVSYKVTENIDPNYANQMHFASVKAAKTGTSVDGADSEVSFVAARGDEWTVTFTNKECKGKITITKKEEGSTGRALPNAQFQLKDAQGNIVKWVDSDGVEHDKLTTNNSGKGTYNNLPYGTYTLDETDPPVGYAKTGDWPKTIVIGDGEGEYTTYEPVYENRKTKADITLTKFVGRAQEDVSDFPQVSSTYHQNCGTFVLQRTIAANPTESDWETVVNDINGVEISKSLNDHGTITAEVAATDGSNNQYKYRFVETVASGYYPVVETAPGTYTNKPTATTSATQPKTVAVGGSQTFSMYNRQKFAIQVYKNYYQYDANGGRTTGAVNPTNGTGNAPSTADWTVPVTLYRYSGTGDPTSVDQLTEISTKNAKSSSTEAKWKDLVVYDENATYTYYVKETLPTTGNGSNFTYFDVNTSLQGKTYVELPANSGNYYVKVTMTNATNDVGLFNYEDAIPIRVRKFVGATGTTTLAGCTVTIYTDPDCADNHIAYDAQTGAKLENVSLPRNSTGAYIYLKTGQKYYYKETGIASGYTFLNMITDNSSTYGNSSTTTTTNLGTIDLTDLEQPTMQNRPNNNSGGYKYKTYTVRNKQNPDVTFAKKTMGQQHDLSGAKFAVFTRTGTEGNYTYTFVTEFDLSSAASAHKALAAGTYYVAEIQVPEPANGDRYLNPNSANAAAEYNRVATLLGRKVDGTNAISYYYDANASYGGTTGLTFTEITVTDSTRSFTFYNIYLKEKVQVQKTIDGEDVQMAGFTVEIYKADANGQPTGEPVGTAQTNNHGVAQIQGLPLYDDNGNRITYVVKEGPASGWGTSQTHDDLVSKYYFVSDGQTFKLEVQESGSAYNSKDLQGNTLKVNNATNINIKATKYQFDGWQWSHGGMRFTMDGVTVGLYRRVAVAEGQTPNAWEAVKDDNNQPITAITANGGQVSFSGLPRGTGTGDDAVQYEYALVEIASNDEKYFPYQENPKNAANSAWKAYPTAGEPIADTALKEYNALVLLASQITVAQKEYDLLDMNNSNHWVQFHVKKWLDEHHLTDYYVDGQLVSQGNTSLGLGDPTTGHRRWGIDRAPGAPDTALDDCTYSLYRYILTESDNNSVTFVKEDSDEPGHWKRVGTYMSGQLLDANDNPVPGEFLTDLDTGINDNYVYVLVEDNVGPNSCIPNPYYVYTFWYSENHAPVTCTADGGTIGRTFTYTMDSKNHTDVLNSWNPGPGTGNILLAALRLTKWRDSYDENGNRKQEYEPLNNVQFTVSLLDGTVIANMTTGLDGDANVSKAQSGVFQLVWGTGANEGKIFLYEYEVPQESAKKYDVTTSITEFTDPDHPTYKIYGIPVNVKETGAPGGYGYYPDDYMTYLIFVDKDPTGTGNKFRFFSDLYFVTTTDKTIHLAEYQEDRLWHATEAASDNPLTLGDPLQRIVDYPMVNTWVEIRKVGYVPTSDTVTLAQTAGADYSEKIAKGNYGAVALPGVTLKLQRLDEEGDGTWKDWDYSLGEHGNWGTKTFATLSEGEYEIPNGLTMGKYRVYETSLGAHANDYENAYLQADGHYREFTVGGVPVVIYMANPEKIDLKITKKNMGTNEAVTGMTFKLGNLTASESPAGTYTFSNISTGTYKLTETGPANISTENFAEWFAAAYPDLAALVGNGMKLGYTYALNGADGGKDVGITAIAPWDSSNDKIIELEIKNPAKTTVTLKKFDLEDTENATGLNGASFTYFYKPFEELSGDVSVVLPTIVDGTATSVVRDTFTGAGWTDKGDITVPAAGKVLENLEPGIYAFYETGAPSGYDRLIVNNNVVIYTAVVTGGLPVEVTVTPSSVTVDEITVPTNFESKTGAAVDVAAKDPVKATIKAKKDVDAGDLSNADIGNWSVTLNLYDQETGGEIAGSATITKGQNPSDVYFKKGNSTAYFSVGKTYYLEEVVNTDSTYVTDAAHFILTTVKIGDRVITLQDGDTRYAIPVESAEGFTISVTNQYLYGRVDFRKYDAATQTLLSDAEFEVLHYDETTEKWVVIPGSKVEEIKSGNEGTGRYKAFIPLDSANETTYRIRETVAPPNHVPDPIKDYIEVKLKFDPDANPHGNKLDFTIGTPGQGTYFTNATGNPLEVIKFNNVKGASEIGYAGINRVSFSLYHWDTKRNPAAWVFVAEETIVAADGKITFDGQNLLAPYEKYAVAETYLDPDLYNRLDGIYVGDDTEPQILQDIEAIYPDDSVKTIKDAYVFTNSGTTGTITLNAYNVPYLKPTIIKLDVGRYPDGVFAQMNFKVYEVSANFVATQASVEDLVANYTEPTEENPLPRLVFQGNTSTQVTGKLNPHDPADQTTYQGTSVVWKDADKKAGTDTSTLSRWDPAKYYILVETKVFGDQTYDTMVKDDPRVVWYLPIDPVADPTGSEEFILTNINGVADVEIDKAVVPSEYTSVEEAADTDNAVVGTNVGTQNEKFEVESLLKGDRKVVYTLAPTVTGKNQMLKSFVLTEDGLTAGVPATPEYEITKVVVGGATQVLPAALELTSADILADIVFTKANGSTTSETGLVVFTEGAAKNVTVNAPATTQSFNITYYSPEVTQKAPAYTLAEEFTPSASTVYMTVKQIPDGTVDPDGTTHPATEITKFTNKSEVSLKYDKWKNDGSAKTEVTETDDDTAVINVTELKLPLISVSKGSDTTTAFAGSRVKYTLTVTNKSDSPADFVNPVLIDILPTGVNYENVDGYPVVSTGTQGEILTLDSVMVKEGKAVQGPVEVDGTVYSDVEKCVIFRLGGENNQPGILHPGSSLTVEFYAMITPSAVAYDTPSGEDEDTKASIRNDVYLSSTAHTYHTNNNPYGYSFAVNKTTSGYVFGEPIDIAASHNPSAALHEQGVHEELGKDSTYPYTTPAQYRWVTDNDTIPVVIGNQLNLFKAVKGDQDAGFHTSGVGIATRTVDQQTQTHNPQYGHVDWQLEINNGQDEAAMDIVVGDAIPKYGDDINRKSQWDVIFDSVIGITNNKVDVQPEMYTVWYYTGPINGASDEVKTAMGNVRSWTASSHDDNWSTSMPANKETITGFIIVFAGGSDPNNSFIIKAGHTAIITYHTKVKAYNSDSEFANIAFLNATNDFFVRYSGYSLLQVSNPVSVTLMDGKVQVEGDVWIDEDWDDTQQSTGNRRDYTEYAIINTLADSIRFSITDGRNSSSWLEDSTHGANTNPGYGESIRHFTFSELGAAAYVEGRTLYGPDNYLNVGSHKIPGQQIALKGTDPFHYYLGAEIYRNASTLLDVFTLVNRGTGHYKSDDPDHELTATADTSLDSNFDGSNGNYSTYPFYVRYSNLWDQSKDIGFRMTRSLELTKVAQDDETIVVPGAKFSVYGPFGDTTPAKDYTPAGPHTFASGDPLTFSGTAGNYVLDASGTITELTTDSNGKIVISGLNWWKEYDIKEVEPVVPGYSITGATAAAGANTQIVDHGDGKFTLLVPSTRKTDPTEKVTVKDPRKVEVQLEVEKILKMYSSDPMTFDFKYWLTSTDPSNLMQLKPNSDLGKDEDHPIETITVTVTGTPTDGIRTAIGSFKTITLNGAGTYVFSIKEIPDPNSNVQYDEATKTATVVVEWDNTAKKLVVKSITYSDPDTVTVGGVQKTYEKFTNEYTSEPVEATPHATKSLSGEEVSYDITFTFKLTANTVVKDGAYLDYDPAGQNIAIVSGDNWSKDLLVPAGTVPGTVDFDEITYTEPGTYTYTIVETATSPDPHFEYSDVEWTYEVVIGYDDVGNLEIKTETYTPDKVVGNFGANSSTATFVNKYTPTPVSYEPMVKKVMSEGSEPLPEDKTFNFRLTLTDQKTAAGDNISGGCFKTTPETELANDDVVSEKSITLKAGSTPTNLITDPTQPVSFDGVTFKKAGLYTFIAEELPGSAAGITYTGVSNPVEFTVTVIDVDGQLTIKAVKVKTGTPTTSYEINGNTLVITAVFTNTYTVTPVDYQPKVKKVMGAGSEPLSKKETFYFELELTDQKTANGDPITNGCYKSTAPLANGDLVSEKYIEVPAGTRPTDTIEPVSFDGVTFKKAGLYTFTAKERQGSSAGITYTGALNPVEFTVTVIDESAVLKIDSVKAKDGTPTTSYEINGNTLIITAIFTNTYTVTPVDYQPKVKKLLGEGSEPLPEDKTFNFKLTLTNQKTADGDDITEGCFKSTTALVNGDTVSEKSITLKAGSTPDNLITEPTQPVSFDGVTFKKAGLYTFKAEELSGSAAGITYNGVNAPVVFTVKVIDKGATLKIDSVSVKDGTPTTSFVIDDDTIIITAIFTNTYTVTPVDYQPKVQKVMGEGSEPLPEAKTFNFQLTLKDQKTAGGDDITEGCFKSTTALANGDTVSTKSVTVPAGTKPGDTIESVSFDGVTFKKAGLYTFTAEELSGSAAGITYTGASNPVEFTVTVVDDGAVLKIASVKAKDGTPADNYVIDGRTFVITAKFTNTYTVTPVEYQPKVKKVMSSDSNTLPNEITFDFKLTLLDQKRADGTTDITNGCYKEDTALNNNDVVSEKSIKLKAGSTPTNLITDPTQPVSFDGVTFKKAGLYTFKAEELKGTVNGVTYTGFDNPVEFTVEVKDENAELIIKSIKVKDGTPTTSYEIASDGTLVITAIFTNKYIPEPVKAKFNVKKILDGEPLSQLTEAELKAIIFTFELADEGENDSSGYEMPPVAQRTVQITAYEVLQALQQGTECIKFFGDINFLKANPAGKEYVFTIREQRKPSSASGTTGSVQFDDTTVWFVSVVIEDNGGALAVKSGYPKYSAPNRNPSSGPNGVAYFTNTYTPTETTYTPEVKKVMEGEERPANIKREFTFNLQFVSAVRPDGTTPITDGYVYNTPQKTTVKVTDHGTSTFTTITFKKLGTYIFKIWEVDDLDTPTPLDPPERSYYYIDTTPRYLTVVVSDDHDGNLINSYSYSKGDTPESATPVDNATMTNEYHPIPTEYAPPLNKTLLTEYGPTVAEKIFKFTLLALTSYPSSSGADLAPGNSKTITVTIPEGQTTVPVDQSTFEKITYTKQGTYTYQITEEVSSEEGVIDSKAVWNLTIVVEDTGGKLKVTTHNYTLVSGASNPDQASFENTYIPEPTEFTPKGIKTIEAEFGPTVASKIFKFDLTLDTAVAKDTTTDVKDGADIQAETKTIEVAAGETTKEIIFSKITFSKAGTYAYKIVEQVSKEEGITDDTAERTLEIVVTDKDGALYIESYKYSDGEEKSTTADGEVLTGLEAETGADVKNIYKPEPTKYQPEVDKKMTFFYGPTVAEKIFNFDLTLKTALAADGTTDVTDAASLATDSVEVKIPAGQESNPAKFQEITFTKAGTYTFEIKEQPSGEEGITDDTSVWTLVVVITDTDGKLEVTSTKYTSDDTTVPASDSTATFVNPYKPEPTKYTPQVIKDIELETGAPTTLDKTFTFDLKFVSAKAAKDGKDVSDAQLDAAEDDGGKQFVSDTVVITVPAGDVTGGPASFKTIHFTKAGTYKYEIRERMSLELGMTYDVAVWTLTVVVTDKDGKLEVAQTYESDQDHRMDNTTAAEFVNPYATSTLRVEKRVSGAGASTITKFTFNVTLYTENPLTGIREPLPGEYPVQIFDSKGNVVDTAVVKDGEGTFKLRHNQYAIVYNIPVGAKWEVKEEKFTGYATSAETPNSGTIQKTGNISKWKNHRSTVPPVPKTGYGDGTTVKIGLFSSLGVFLASAIGSILQSKNAKKKKRGGGSHAAE